MLLPRNGKYESQQNETSTKFPIKKQKLKIQQNNKTTKIKNEKVEAKLRKRAPQRQ